MNLERIVLILLTVPLRVMHDTQTFSHPYYTLFHVVEPIFLAYRRSRERHPQVLPLVLHPPSRYWRPESQRFVGLPTPPRYEQTPHKPTSYSDSCCRSRLHGSRSSRSTMYLVNRFSERQRVTVPTLDQMVLSCPPAPRRTSWRHSRRARTGYQKITYEHDEVQRCRGGESFLHLTPTRAFIARLSGVSPDLH